MLERWESPDIAITEVHNDFAEHLAAAIGSAKHEGSRLEIYGIRAGLRLDRTRSTIKVDSDRTKRDCNKKQKEFHDNVKFHGTLPLRLKRSGDS